MSGLACLFGLHLPESVSFTAVLDDHLVLVTRVRCAQCGARIAEEVRPVA